MKRSIIGWARCLALAVDIIKRSNLFTDRLYFYFYAGLLRLFNLIVIIIFNKDKNISMYLNRCILL